MPFFSLYRFLLLMDHALARFYNCVRGRQLIYKVFRIYTIYVSQDDDRSRVRNLWISSRHLNNLHDSFQSLCWHKVTILITDVTFIFCPPVLGTYSTIHFINSPFYKHSHIFEHKNSDRLIMSNLHANRPKALPSNPLIPSNNTAFRVYIFISMFSFCALQTV